MDHRISRPAARGGIAAFLALCAAAALTGGLALALAPGTARAAAPEAGVYTVTANIWIEGADADLPLSPHLTNAGFPPSGAVAGNAVLEVDESGNAQVTVPIVIQHEVMQVNSLDGLPIVAQQAEDGAISSVTVDLGPVDADDPVMTEGCTANVTLGGRAAQMTGQSGGKSWPATFEVDISGSQAVATGDAAERAEAAALAASDAQDAAQRAAGFPPFVPIVIGVAVVAAIAIAVALVRRRRRDGDAAS